MAGGSETVDLTFRANIQQLRDELAKIPGITDKEAKKMVGALDKQLKRTEKSAKKASKANKKAFKGMEDAASEADSVLQGLASSLDIIDPRLGSIARVAGDMSGGLEAATRASTGLGVYLGAAGAAVTALGAAWFYLRQEEEKANDEIERSRHELNDMIRLTDQMAAAKLELRIASGQLTDEEIRQARAAQKTEAVYGAALETARARYGETKIAAEQAAVALADLEENQTSLAGKMLAGKTSLRAVNVELETARSAAQDTATAYAGATGELRNLNAQSDKYTEIIAATDLENYRAKQQGTALAVSDTTSALAELDTIARGAFQSRLSGEDLILSRLEDEYAQIRKLEQATGDHEKATRARTEVSLAAGAEIDAINAAAAAAESERMDALDRKKDEQSDRDIARAEDDAEAIKRASLDLADTLASATADVFDLALDQRVASFDDARSALSELDETATTAERKAAEQLVKDTKAAAREAFFASQNAAVASAIINGAIAVTRQFADLPAPAAIISSAAIATMTGVQVATILSQSPTFHRGGMVGDPSERTITARAGEGLLTAQGIQAIGGPAGLDAANRGGGAGGAVTVQFRVGNAIASEIVYTGARGPGRGRQSTRALRPRGRTNPYRKAI